MNKQGFGAKDIQVQDPAVRRNASHGKSGICAVSQGCENSFRIGADLAFWVSSLLDTANSTILSVTSVTTGGQRKHRQDAYAP